MDQQQRTVAARQVLRLAQDYFLSGAELISRALGLELGPSLVFLAINWANVGHRTNPGLPRSPVSMYAIAQMLDVPYENVRRHVGLLIEARYCQRLPTGFVIDDDGEQVEAIGRAVAAVWGATAAYVKDLSETGLELPDGHPDPAFDPAARVATLATGHFLNMVAILRRTFDVDLVSAVVEIAIIRANTWHLTRDPPFAAAFGGTMTIPPDQLRRPVSVYRLSRTLGLPYETTRRHVLKLVAAGLCESVPTGGYWVPAEVLARPSMVAVVTDVGAEVVRYLRALSSVVTLPLAETPLRRGALD